MKINRLQINSFGKIKNKELNLNKNINIIYGKNESGKSTLQKFILSSLYGIAKTKNGKELSDYERFKPWNSEDFSGKIEYELNNGGQFEIYRDFNKKNPVIFNSSKEDISKTFNINKKSGNEFFYEQTGVTEDLFLSTLFIEQNAVRLEKNNQNILVQKIANLVNTGEDNVSYKLALDRINRRQLEEIGTERSREKPINIISKKIEDLENEKNELEIFKNFNSKNEDDKKIIIEKINELENEKEILKEINKINNSEKNKKEKININEKIKNENNEKINNNKKIKNENNEKINLIEKEIEKIKKENKNIFEKNIKNNNKIFLIISVIIILLNIIQFIFIKNKIINLILFLTVPTDFIFYLINIKNKKEKILKNNISEINNLINNKENEINKIKENNLILENEINLLEKNNLFLENEIKNIEEKNNFENNLEKEKIKLKYLNKLNENKINLLLIEKNPENKLEKINEEINIEKIKYESLKFEEKNLNEKLEKLINIEEEISINKEKYDNLKKLEKSFELTKNILEKSYEKMKNGIAPKFTKNLSQRISNITNGKYNNINLNNDNEIIVELENGNYLPIIRLSTGTIDQIYLSLRLSMLDELSEESLPIILDETFAYWDDERLENILKFLIDESEKRQIIIFTCSNREYNLLNKLCENYNLIEI